MSRSLHTRPRAILADSRLRAPYDRRGVADIRRSYRLRRQLKESGLSPGGTRCRRAAVGETPLPRIQRARVSPPWHHPAGCAEIESLLRHFGAEIRYGLRAIELAGPVSHQSDQLCFGTLSVPGRITLFAQPLSPWTLLGVLSDSDRQRFERAGATVEYVGDGAQTVVNWPDGSLRDFMLLDVLLHEIGHHVFQHYTGKRSVRVVRTTDHEAFAELFARRLRDEYRSA